MTFTLDDALTGIMGNTDLPSLEPVLHDITSRFGFIAATYADVSHVPLPHEPVPYFTTSLPKTFLNDYLTHDLPSFDPTVRQAAVSNAPFRWSDVPDYSHHMRPRPGVRGRVRMLVELAMDSGYREGYVLPCHAPDATGRMRSGIISLFWPGEPEEMTRPGALPMWLRLAGLVYHERILALRSAVEDGEADQVTLTDRERECLSWACRGKTNGETASILNISERTVGYHVNNTMRKLGVHSKVHAVAVAVHRGLVSP